MTGGTADKTVGILILCKDRRSFAEPLKYLQTRGFPTSITESYEEAIEILKREKPQYVIVSLNNSDQKCLSAHTEFPEIVPTRVIAALEATDLDSLKLMNDCDFFYKLRPPLTGQHIRDYIAEIEKSFPEQNEGIGKTPPGAEDMKNVKGSSLPPMKAPSKKAEPSQPKLSAVPSTFNTKEVIAENINGAFAGIPNIELKEENYNETKKLAVITVSSQEMSGYLLLAVEKGQKFDDSLLNKIQEQLCEYMTTQGHSNDTFKNVQLDVEEVNFVQWAEKKAQFLLGKCFDEQDIAFAFFSKTNVSINFAPSHQENKVSIDIHTLKAGRPHQFNLYVFLSAVGRYHLFATELEVLTEEKLSRLKESPVDTMHIDVDDCEKFHHYHTGTQIDSLIKEMHQ